MRLPRFGIVGQANQVLGHPLCRLSTSCENDFQVENATQAGDEK